MIEFKIYLTNIKNAVKFIRAAFLERTKKPHRKNIYNSWWTGRC